MRPITPSEKDLIIHLINLIPKKERQYEIPTMVNQFDDSIATLMFLEDQFGKDLIHAHYKDSDGQLVLITLVEGKSGSLYELDFWKVFFTINHFPYCR